MNHASELLLTAFNLATTQERQRLQWRERQRRYREKLAKSKPRKTGFKKPLPEQKPEPSQDNLPTPTTACPRCKASTNGFRWCPKELTWRCAVCRVPVRFEGEYTMLNFLRGKSHSTRVGWKQPKSSDRVKLAAIALGTELLEGARPKVEVRRLLRNAGHHLRTINNAVSVLRVTETQPVRPGPLIWSLPEKVRGTVMRWTGELIVELLEKRIAEWDRELQSSKKTSKR